MKTELPLDESEKRRLVLKLVSQLHCLACGQPYEREDFSLVHRDEDVWILSSHCRRCEGHSHVVIFMQLDAEAGPVTDLSLEELQSCAELPAITADDVLDMHLFLREFEGDLGDLLPGY